MALWIVEAAGSDDVLAWLSERLTPFGVTLLDDGDGEEVLFCLCAAPWLAIDAGVLPLTGEDGPIELSRELSTRIVAFEEEEGGWQCRCIETGNVAVTGSGSADEAMAADLWGALSTWFAPPEGSGREPWLPLRAPATMDQIARGLGLRGRHGESCRTMVAQREM